MIPSTPTAGMPPPLPRLLGKRADGLQGAGAHELGDVLAVTAFSAMDHFAKRNSER
jgi:hypothetical protein